jgi:hypothetical protein
MENLLSARALDTDHELRLRHTQHPGARSVLLDAKIDEFRPLFEKMPCHSELLDASIEASVAIIDSAIKSESE